MSADPAIARLEAEIERREDEIVALREVIAMLTGGSPKPAALPPPAPEPKRRAVTTPARAARTGDTAITIAGVTVHLSDKEREAYDLLKANKTVSADAMADIFGDGQRRHQAMFALRQKLEAAYLSVTWQKGEGYTMREALP